MPIYMVSFNDCECFPVPDMAIRADDMVSAVMQAQEKLSSINHKAEEAHVETCCDLTIESIGEVTFELFDEAGIESVVDTWKEFAEDFK